MSLNKCARCEQTVYPVEGLRCLDKIWHKGCFKCHECNMTLSLKNYKGFEKRPYCNAHCPQAKATTVADTPEIRRLAENTRIQSQAKYHEEFEKSKGKGFTTVLDDPETRRIKETSKIISNVAYHGELERKKQMEERRGLSGPEELPLAKSTSQVRHHNITSHDSPDQSTQNHMDQSQQLQHQRQVQQLQQQQLLQKQQQQQQLLLKQQQQQHQQQYIQNNNGQQFMHRQPSHFVDGHQQQMANRHVQQQQQLQQHYSNNQHQQQQLLMRQQQQQQQIIMQHRQSLDSSLPLNRQPSKQAINANSHPPQQLIKQQQFVQSPHRVQQQPNAMMKYAPMNENIGNPQAIAPHLVGPQAHMVGQPHQMGGIIQSSQRMGPGCVPQPQPMHNYNPHQMNGMVPKQLHYMNQQQQISQHPNQLKHQQPMQQRQIQQIPLQQPVSQVPRRVFRAMYDYMAHDVDEVSFFENDILIDCVNVDRNWLIGKVARTGQTGMLPANYVAEIPNQ